MVPAMASDVETLLKLLPDVQDINEAARGVMVAGLPHALGTHPSQRHAFQSSFAGAAKEALEGAIKAVKERQKQAADAVDAARKVVGDRSAHLEAVRISAAQLEQ